ncbi:MAG: alpha/beta hydrolase [Promethearchaeota archaeon]
MNLIFIHGLESSGKGFKGRFFQEQLPGILTPDFTGSLKQRMEQLHFILEKKTSWVIIGSSFGGLMATLYTFHYPQKVFKLILLAPLLTVPELEPSKLSSIDTPVILYHGKKDEIIPWKKTFTRAKQLFNNLTCNLVEDDHLLHATIKNIDWKQLIYQGS